MFSKAYGAAVTGIEASVVRAEADVSDGLPAFEMVGYLASELGDRRAALVREISKLHEECVRFVLTELPEDITVKGEMVLVVEGASGNSTLCDLTVEEHFDSYIRRGMDEKEAMKAVAKDRGVSKSEIYSKLKCK